MFYFLSRILTWLLVSWLKIVLVWTCYLFHWGMKITSARRQEMVTIINTWYGSKYKQGLNQNMNNIFIAALFPVHCEFNIASSPSWFLEHYPTPTDSAALPILGLVSAIFTASLGFSDIDRRYPKPCVALDLCYVNLALLHQGYFAKSFKVAFIVLQ